MNKLYIRLDEEYGAKVAQLMKETDKSAQKAGMQILRTFFDSQDKPKKKAVSKPKFVKPEFAELAQYFLEKGSMTCQDDAEAFIDHYTANGWKVGKAKTPMQNWKSTVNNWMRMRKQNGQQSGSKATLSNLGDTDF